MLHNPGVLKVGGVALVLLMLVSLLASPLMASAQGPTSTSTPTTEPTAGATAQATTTATTEATQAAEPTRLPPCPLPAGAAVPTASATEEATSAATEMATVPATDEGTAQATGEATSAATEPPPFEPGYLGIAGEDLDSCGTRVVDVLPDSPAEAAGVQLDDVIVGIGTTAYPGVLALREYITTQPVGAELELVIRRNGAELILDVILGTRPTVVPPTVTPAG